MTQESSERRQLYALRSHIDTLLAAGASLEGRDPVRLSLDGQILIVRHGMLVSENSYLDIIETLSNTEWPSENQRNQAIEMCLHHLVQAIDQAELTLRCWEREEALAD